MCLKGSEQNVDSGSRSLKVILPNPPAQFQRAFKIYKAAESKDFLQ